jgi:cytosine deaminase
VADAFYPFGAADQGRSRCCSPTRPGSRRPSRSSKARRGQYRGGARVVKRDGYGLLPGCRADRLVLNAESMPEALRQQAPRRWVVRASRLVAETDQRRTLHR